MARKSKYMTGKPFTPEVSDAIRHHVGVGRELENARKDAFEDRNAAVEEINEIADEDSDEAHEARTRHSKAIIQIDSLTERIAWHNKQVKQFVEKADEPELDFMYDMPPDAKAEAKKKADAEQMKLGDGKPVGGRGLPAAGPGSPAHERGVGKPGKKPAASADASRGDGHNEHFKVHVNELDMQERLIGLCVTAGIVHVIDFIELMNECPTVPDICVRTNWDAKDVKAIVAAVEKFRKKHRKAAAEVEKEGAIL
mgnify:CR=1 FL=1